MSKIYESPDGGKTIYERQFGTPSKTLIKMNNDNINWTEVEELSKTNPTLQKALDNVKLIYKIIKEESND